MNGQETPEQKAIRLLNRQLGELQTIRALNHEDPKFKAWRDTTQGLLERFLGENNNHSDRFFHTRFFSQVSQAYFGRRPPGYVAPEHAQAFQQGCATAEETLKAAIREIEDFGVHVEEAVQTPTGKRKGGGFTQNFHGTVNMNQAVAMDSAVQRISRGDTSGVDLKAISDLLQQSQDLSPNQVRQGVVDIEALAVEAEKPEQKRNWKAVLDVGQRVLDLAVKAVDLGTKLAPHLPAIVAMVETAGRHLS